MAAHFARLLIKGVTNLFLVWLILFTLLTYLPGGAVDKVRTRLYADPRYPPSDLFIRLEQARFHTDKPWPLSFLYQLFDPDAITFEEVYGERTFLYETLVPKGDGINLFGLHIQGSGILTGDFGESTDVARGELVFGGAGFMFLLLTALVVIPMLLVVIRRWGRPLPHNFHHPKLPRTVVPRYLHPNGAMFELCEVPMRGSDLRRTPPTR